MKDKYPGAEGYKKLQSTKFGGAVICEDRQLLLEEASEAYKPVEDIVEDLGDLADVIAVMRPLVTYKMRREE